MICLICGAPALWSVRDEDHSREACGRHLNMVATIVWGADCESRMILDRVGDE